MQTYAMPLSSESGSKFSIAFPSVVYRILGASAFFTWKCLRLSGSPWRWSSLNLFGHNKKAIPSIRSKVFTALIDRRREAKSKAGLVVLDKRYAFREQRGCSESSILITVVVNLRTEQAESANGSISFIRQLRVAETILLFICILDNLHLCFLNDPLAFGGDVGETLMPWCSHDGPYFGDFHTDVVHKSKKHTYRGGAFRIEQSHRAWHSSLGGSTKEFDQLAMTTSSLRGDFPSLHMLCYRRLTFFRDYLVQRVGKLEEALIPCISHTRLNIISANFFYGEL